MKIVIDIPEEDYKRIKSEVQKFGGSYRDWEEEIANGTPLPEHHGDLIDRDSLELDSDWSDYYDGFSAYSESQVRRAPTIIEAEGSDSE